MKITYTNINKFQQDKFQEQIAIAQGFLRQIYNNPNFDNVEYIFSNGACPSRYYRNEIPDGKYINPVIRISNRSELYLYEKKSLGLKKYALNVGNYVQVICALVHELTHHIQYNEKRSRGELETTKNEVEFLRVFYPDYYKELLK